jgi:hypothetical protein
LKAGSGIYQLIANLPIRWQTDAINNCIECNETTFVLIKDNRAIGFENQNVRVRFRRNTVAMGCRSESQASARIADCISKTQIASVGDGVSIICSSGRAGSVKAKTVLAVCPREGGITVKGNVGRCVVYRQL